MSETVGVDVGGTKLSVARLDGSGLSDPTSTPTETGSPERLIDQIATAVSQLRTSATAAVGVGVPSVVDFASGRARSSVNVPLVDVPLRTELESRLGLPVYVDNDATVAALAEAWDGSRIAVDSLAMLTVGTGVGGGLVLGGRVYRGATGAAAEAGHMLIATAFGTAEPAVGGFPQPGSLESLAAGPVLDRAARELAEVDPDSGLGRREAAAGAVGARELVEEAEAGDEQAALALRRFAEPLGVGIANLINLLDPEVVAVGGGVSAAGAWLLDPAAEVARRFVLPGVGTATEIRLARAGAGAGVLGAALLARTELGR